MYLDKSLIYLSEALPLKERAFSLRTAFNNSLIDSLNYLLGICTDVIPSDLFSKATEKLNSISPKLKLSGHLSALHVDFFSAAEEQDIQKINLIIESLCKNEFQIKSLKYINMSNLNEYYSPLVQHIFSQETLEDVKYLSLLPHEFEQVKKSLQRGVKILKYLFPNFFSEFQELVSEILIINAQGLKGGSSSDLYGMIYINYLYKWEKITDALDFIIHEQSHLYLHLLNKDDAIILNPKERHESPLRKEKRHLIGVYHATFVLARIYYVLTKSLTLNEIPENEREYCQELTEYYKKRFHVGFNVLQTHAQMTPLGQALIISARKLVPI